MDIMITGSSGILGNYVCMLLEKHKNVNVIKFKGDITNNENVSKNFKKINKLDYVLHLAAMVPVIEVEKNPAKAFSVNVTGTINLFNAFEKYELKPYFFYASSSHIYSQCNKPIRENFQTKPLNLYGKTKLIAENIAHELCKQNNQKFCSGRIFSFFDKRQPPTYLYPNIKKRLKQEDLDKPFFISNGKSIRDFLSAEKVAMIITKLIMKNTTGFINIGSGVGVSISDFVQSLSKKKLNIQTNEHKSILVADTKKLSRIIK